MKRILLLLLLSSSAAHADSISIQQQEAKARYDAKATAATTSLATGVANGAASSTTYMGGSAQAGINKAVGSPSYQSDRRSTYKPQTSMLQCKYNPVLCQNQHQMPTSRANVEMRPQNAKVIIGKMYGH